MYISDHRGRNNDLNHLEFKNSYMIPNLVNFLKDSQTDIFWKFYLATIYFLGHLYNDNNSDDSDFKKCDSSFGQFPERLSH